MKYLFILLVVCCLGCVEEIKEPVAETTAIKTFKYNAKWEETDTILNFGYDGTITFYAKGEEVLRISPEGKFYVAGRCTAKNMRVYLKFKKWIECIYGIVFEEKE